jgi:hypothetical protein
VSLHRFADIERVKILSARRPANARLAMRRAGDHKAVRDAERTNAEMFASSFSGKWGDMIQKGWPSGKMLSVHRIQ